MVHVTQSNQYVFLRAYDGQNGMDTVGTPRMFSLTHTKPLVVHVKWKDPEGILWDPRNAGGCLSCSGLRRLLGFVLDHFECTPVDLQPLLREKSLGKNTKPSLARDLKIISK